MDVYRWEMERLAQDDNDFATWLSRQKTRVIVPTTPSSGIAEDHQDSELPPTPVFELAPFSYALMGVFMYGML